MRAARTKAMDGLRAARSPTDCLASPATKLLVGVAGKKRTRPEILKALLQNAERHASSASPKRMRTRKTLMTRSPSDKLTPCSNALLRKSLKHSTLKTMARHSAAVAASTKAAADADAAAATVAKEDKPSDAHTPRLVAVKRDVKTPLSERQGNTVAVSRTPKEMVCTPVVLSQALGGTAILAAVVSDE